MSWPFSILAAVNIARSALKYARFSCDFYSKLKKWLCHVKVAQKKEKPMLNGLLKLPAPDSRFAGVILKHKLVRRILARFESLYNFGAVVLIWKHRSGESPVFFTA